MDDFVNSMDAFFSDYFDLSFPNIHVTDVVEVLIIAAFFYEVLILIKNTRAWMLFRGILFILAMFLVAALFQMNTILWLGERLFNAGMIAVIVVFQPELRHALEQLGRQDFLLSFNFLSTFAQTSEKRFEDRMIAELVSACYAMAAVKTGALIVIEQDVRLTEQERTGIKMDALVSRQLLLNIFEKNTPLHDGAIIIRGDRIVAATCYLPLTDNLALSKDLGTRHRAAVGISEVSDALTIVVSEETGQVSVAQDRKLIRNVSATGMEDILRHAQRPDAYEIIGEQPRSFLLRRLFKRKGGAANVG